MSYGIQEALEQMQQMLDNGVDPNVVADFGQSAADSYNANPSPGGADVGMDQWYGDEENQQYDPQPGYTPGYNPNDAAPYIAPPGFPIPGTGGQVQQPGGMIQAPWYPGPQQTGPAQAQAQQNPMGPTTGVPGTPPAAPAQPGKPNAPAAGQGGTPIQQLQAMNPTQRSEVLREFLESDPYLILNHSLNELRKRGAAGMFQRWFSQNFNRFLGEYQGLIAQQALNGEVPSVTFVDYVLGLDLANERARSAGLDQPGQLNYRFANFLQTAGANVR